MSSTSREVTQGGISRYHITNGTYRHLFSHRTIPIITMTVPLFDLPSCVFTMSEYKLEKCLNFFVGNLYSP
ncbi:Uncharacterised protein r2_g2637 [Pycnogonum litorale]